MKIVISLLLCASLVFAWISVVKQYMGTAVMYDSYVERAQQSYNDRLYEQAAEYYNKALGLDSSDASLYILIKDAYKDYYEEQQTSKSKAKYMSALVTCCEVYDSDPELYEELIKNYYDSGDFTSVNKYLKKAERKGVSSDYLTKMNSNLDRMYVISRADFHAYRYTMRGRYIVQDGDSFWVTDNKGKRLGDIYAFIGHLDKDGYAVYRDAAGFSVRDGGQIARLKLSFEIEDCGYYSDGLLPAKIDGQYVYIDKQGADSGIGTFEYASNMIGGCAAVLKNGKWGIISSDGKVIVDYIYDDVALDIYERYTGGSFYAANENGKYSLFDVGGERIGSFTSADIDISTDKEIFAFKDSGSGLWGFADRVGNTVIEPAYTEAKGFSNGYAAVKNDDGLWGFINISNELVVDYAFYDAGYFTADENCVVATSETQYGILSFVYR